jgi:hypothetical protein
MIFRTTLLLAASFLAAVTAQDDTAARDIQLGMQGLMEAGKDPAILAQLMKDLQVRVYYSVCLWSTFCLQHVPLASSSSSSRNANHCSRSRTFLVPSWHRSSDDTQDPELMAEAKKMMEDPNFKKKMKDMTGGKDFKESIKKTKEMLDDPNKAAAAEAKFEHMQRVGNDRLKQGAVNDMEQAMAALANPEVMAEMTKMLKDPKFKDTLSAMASDPQFQNYMEVMQDMVKDPTKRKKIEAVSEAVKSQL